MKNNNPHAANRIDNIITALNSVLFKRRADWGIQKMEGGNGVRIQASRGCKPVGVSATNVITHSPER